LVRLVGWNGMGDGLVKEAHMFYRQMRFFEEQFYIKRLAGP
jgi:hypothetical protein